MSTNDTQYKIEQLIDYVLNWRSEHHISEADQLSSGQRTQLARDIQTKMGQLHLSYEVPPGGNVLPYNGWMQEIAAWKVAAAASQGSNGALYYISDTEAGKLLNSTPFRNAIIEAVGDPALGNAMLDGVQVEKTVNGETIKVRTQYGAGDVLALNDFVSRNLMLANAHGDIITLTSESVPNSVWTLTELPTLLEMEQVRSIDGIPRTQLLNEKRVLMETFGMSEEQALNGIRERVAQASKANMAKVELFLGETTEWVDANGNKNYSTEVKGVDLSRLIGGPERAAPEGTARVASVADFIDGSTPEQRAAALESTNELVRRIGDTEVGRSTSETARLLEETMRVSPETGLKTSSPVLSEAAKYARARGIALKGMGALGGVLIAIDGINMVAEANAAYQSGNSELGNKIVRDWVLETAGGFATSALFMEAVAPFALALGTAGGPIGIAAGLLLELGAGIVGWAVGSELGHALSDLFGSIRDLFHTSEDTISPLILDLDGDGIETTSLNNGIAFDHDNNGFAEKSAWVGKDDGLLVWDRNGNGRIDSGQELFGSNTILSSGAKSANGFEALVDIDGNHDGVIDSKDAVFSELRIWKDLNGDGKTNDGELLSLEEAGVLSISTGYSASTIVDAQGNEHKQVGTFTRTDGTTAAMNDVWFRTDAMYSVSTSPLEETAEVAGLPDLQGFGNVGSLHQAMLRDGSGHLQSLVAQFVSEPNEAIRKQLITGILYAWAGVENIDPYSRGSDIGDARKLEALERFLGEDYAETWNSQDGTPGPNASAVLKDAFNRLSETVYVQLNAQTYMKSFFSGLPLVWDARTGTVKFDLSGAASDILNVMATNEAAGIAQLNRLASDLTLLQLTGIVNYDTFRDTFAAHGPQYALIIDVAGKSQVQGTFENDTFNGTYANEAFWGSDGDDSISGNYGDDYLFGDSGNDTINGGDNNDKLSGGTGNDLLYGGSGSDILDGGAGNDKLYGGDSSDTSNTRSNGADTYVFGRGYGEDTIIDFDGTEAVADTIQFADGIQPGDVTVRRSGNHLELSINGTSDKLIVSNYFEASGKYVVEHVRFADGTVWETAEVREAARSLSGTESDDSLSGYDTHDILRGFGGGDTLTGKGGDDVLDGGAGNDTLYGGDSSDTSYTRANGNDTYLFGRGYGQDTVVDYDGTEGSADVIRLAADVSPGDVAVRRSGSSLELAIRGTTDKLTVSNYFEASGKYVVESIVFADGTVWDAAYVREKARFISGSETGETLNGYEDNDTIRGFGGDDSLSGKAGDDVLDGGSGDDVLYGNAGSDRLAGGIGADSLYGGEGNDVLDGGAGNDTLYGGESSDTSYTRANGSDTYMFGRGYGQDTIVDYDGTEGSADVIRLAEDVLPSDVTVRRSGSSLELLLNGTSDKLTVSNFFEASGKYVVESAVFADGTVWDAAALRAAALRITGTESGESLSGFDTGDTISGLGGDDRLYGSAGDDVLDGGAGNDTLYGGDSNDTSYTRANGSDTYVFGRGYGQDTIIDYDGTAGSADVIRFAEGVRPSDVTVRRSGSSLELLLNGTSDKLTVSSYFDASGKYVVETIVFADGTVWDAAAVRAAARQVNGSEASESLIGYEDNDTIRGFGGDDTLTGNAGDDVLDGGAGDDSLTGSAGNDSLAGGAGSDMLYGNDGNDVLDGGAGNDTLYGGTSSDTSYTRANGDDTYVFGRGYGQDTIVDYDGTAGNADVIRFAADVRPSDVTVRRSGSSLELLLSGTSDKLTVSSFFEASGKYVVESVVFADGTVWDAAALKTAAVQITGTESGETLTGFDTGDTLRGLGGDDRLYGSAGDDVLDGGFGNDTLYGGDSSDTSYTRANGSDTYLFGRGYGQDMIIDYDGTAGNADTIRFAADVRPSDVTVRRSSNSLELLINGTADKLTVSNYFEASGKYVVESIAFADGTVWDTAAVRAAARIVSGSEAGESLTGYEDNDTIRGFGGDDTLTGNAGDDVLDGGSGADTLYGNAGDDRLAGGAGNDTLYGYDGSDVLDGGAGNDTLYGGVSSDTSYTRANGNDTYLFGRGYGQDTIVDYDGTAGNTDVVQFAADVLPSDITLRRSGSSLELLINGTGDKLTVSNYFDASGKYVVETVSFADGTVWDGSYIAANLSTAPTVTTSTLTGTAGDDTLIGSANPDIISGGAGNDVLDGGAGNDTLYGGVSSDTSYTRANGNDTFIFGRGYGQDTIIDYDATAGNTDVIQFAADILPSDVTVRRSGSSLELLLNGTSDKLTVSSFFDPSGKYVVENVRFADGTVWDEAAMKAAALQITGTEASESITGFDTGDTLRGLGGDDKLYGSAGDDVLDGGAGNDTLYGGDSSDTSYTRANGNDTYVFGRGYGEDKIIDYDGTAGNADVITLAADVHPGDVTLRRSGSSLELLINGTGDKLTVSSYFDASGKYVVESIRFADGTVWDTAAIREAVRTIKGTEASDSLAGYEENDTIAGYGGDDSMSGGAGDDTLDGGSGSDSLSGNAGGDYLQGGAGNDTLYGQDGDDVLDGGTGNDTLYGGDSNDSSYTRANGNDTYVFGRGYGQDTIVDYDAAAGNADVIQFAADVLPSDVTVRRSGSSLELLIQGTGDKLTVSNFFDPSGKYVVENVRFADGAVWDAAAIRAAALQITGTEAGESITGFDTGDTLRGLGGDDRLYGSAGDDVLDGGTGNDTLYGGDSSDTSYTRANGNDTYVFGRGYGEDKIIDYDGTAGNTDVIALAADILPGDVTLRRSGSSLELLINGTGDKLTVSSYFESSGKYVVESIRFADGTVWDTAAVREAVRTIKGTEASDSLAGNEENDTILGYGGNDSLTGNAGDDTLDGGNGEDTLYGNAGNDSLSGRAGNDTLYGHDGNDVLDGGAGNDTLYGGDSSDTSYTRANGDDTYLFGRGYGEDKIVDYDGTEGGADVIRFAVDVLPSNVTVRRSGSSLELLIAGTKDKLTVSNFFDASGKYVVESVQFQDGTVWDAAAMKAAALQIAGTDASETITGFDTDDTISGYGGDDRLYGSAGNDTLDGGAGNDTLYGGDSSDASYTRANGNDTYVFGRSYGQDTIVDYDGTAGNADVIQFAADVLPSDVTVRRSGSSLELLLNGTSDKLTVSNYFESSGKYVVETIRFQDGTVWDSEAVRAFVRTIKGTEAGESLDGYEGNDTIAGYGGSDTLTGNAGDDALDGGNGDDRLYGNAGSDSLTGGAGSDTLYGHDGDDVLDGGAGNDTLYGGDSSDTSYTRANGSDTYVFGRGYGQDTIIDYDGTAGNADVIQFAAGVLPSDVTVRRSGSALELVIGGTSDKLTVSKYFDASGKYVVESVQFADGTIWNEAFIREAALLIEGTETADSLSGYETNDTMYGYSGDDSLSGGAGGDQLAGGHGRDRLYGEDGDDRLLGEGGNDTLYGGAGSDVLDGGVGNDTLYGGDSSDTSYTRANGNDTYLFSKGYGQDTIIDYDGTADNSDTIVLASGIRPEDVLLRRSGSHLEIVILGTDDKLTVSKYFDASGRYVVETVRFADGTAWDGAYIREAVLHIKGTEAAESLTGYEGNDEIYAYGGDDTLTGAAGNDRLYGGSGTDWLYGNEGDDWLEGEGGNDYLYGGADNDSLIGSAGNDALYGGAGNDVLIGGEGNDTLYGGESSDSSYTRANGDDTYWFQRGFGQDTIVDYDETAGNMDVIRLAEDIRPDDVLLRRSGSHLELIVIGTSDKLTVSNYFNATGKYEVESVQFADGTAWNRAYIHEAVLQIKGTESIDNLQGYEGNDWLYGYGGDDTLTGNEGDDTLDGGNGSDILKGSAGNDRLWGGADNDTLYGQEGNDLMEGGAGSDTLYGGAGEDILDGGAGNDYLKGNHQSSSSSSAVGGNDTYVFGFGYGQDQIYDYDTTAGNMDIVKMLADNDDIIFSRTGNDLVASLNGTSDSVTVTGWYTDAAYQTEQFVAQNGVHIGSSQIEQLIQAMAAYSSATGASWSQAINEQRSDALQILAQSWSASS